MLFFSQPACSQQGNLYAVVNADNKISSLTQKDIAMIYLGKKISMDGYSRIYPVDYSIKHPNRQKFILEILHKSESQYNSYWARRIFNGKGTPPTIIDDQNNYLDVIENNLNAIGYIYKKINIGNKKIKLIPVIMEDMEKK